MLADGVDLGDVRAAAQERAGERLVVGQSDARHGQRQQRRSAAGDQHEHQIARRQPAEERRDLRGAGLPGRVGHGVACLDDADRTGLGRARRICVVAERRGSPLSARPMLEAHLPLIHRRMPVFDVHHARADARPQELMQRGGHGHAGLAPAHDDDAVDLAQVERAWADAYLIARAATCVFTATAGSTARIAAASTLAMIPRNSSRESGMVQHLK